MRFKLSGAQIQLDFLFFFMLSIMLLYSGTTALSVLMLSLLHEAGHIGALLLQGGRIRSLRFSAFGMVMVPESRRLTLYQECVYVIAGPLTNLLVALVLLLFQNTGAAQISALSLLLGLFNLLPVMALDGGKALWYFLLMYVREETATKAMRVISILALCAMALFGCFLLYQNPRNFSVLIIVVYLTVLLINKPMS